jgi:peptidoglycan/xylan/chitin deacetylase (PgdA/CDA1 family)
MDHALALLADILNSYDAKATLPATAVAVARHGEVASRHQGQSIELAIHGLVHIDHTQLSLDEQREQLGRARAIFAQAGIRATGFRCPYLRWNDDTLVVLSESGFAYDSSQALSWDVVDGRETGAYRRVLAFYGAEPAAEYPSLPRLAGDLVRIPYCVPDDEALVERLQLTDSAPMAGSVFHSAREHCEPRWKRRVPYRRGCGSPAWTR